MSRIRANFLAGFQIQQSHHVVAAAAQNLCSAGREGHAHRRARSQFQVKDQSVIVEVPITEGPVPTGGDGARAVGIDRDAVHAAIVVAENV